MTSRAHRAVALLVAVFLLLGQALLGPGPAMSAAADPFGGVPICHASGDGDPVPAQPAGHGMECVFCVACHGLAGPAVLPAPAVAALVRPAPALAAAPGLPPSRAPPAQPFLAAAYPTGPPILT